MTKARRFDFYPDDWLSGTRELDAAERGVYITACALIYSRGGPIHQDLLRDFCKGDARVYRRSLDRLISLRKLSVKGAYLSQKRCITEVKLAQKRRVTAVENAHKRWAGTNENKDLQMRPHMLRSDAEVMLPSPSPSPITNTSCLTRARPGGFAEWWEGYPHKIGKRAAEKAYRSALSRASESELRQGVERYIGSKPADLQWCNPATWLTQDRWLDEPETGASGVVNGHDKPRGPPPPLTAEQQKLLIEIEHESPQ